MKTEHESAKAGLSPFAVWKNWFSLDLGQDKCLARSSQCLFFCLSQKNNIYASSSKQVIQLSSS